MHKRIKNALLVGIIILLLAACGGFETAPTPTEAPAVPVAETPTSIPTAAPSDGSAPESFSQYIGLNYPPFLPTGFSQGFGMLIQDADGYSLALVTNSVNKMLWLSKVTKYDTTNGNPFWEVRDVLDLSNVEAGLILAPDGCFLNGAPDNEIFAASKNGTIVLAWRANTTLDIFEVIPTNGIECRSDKGISLD